MSVQMQYVNVLFAEHTFRKSADNARHGYDAIGRCNNVGQNGEHIPPCRASMVHWASLNYTTQVNSLHAMACLLEGCRVDHFHSNHLFHVVRLAVFHFDVQGQKVVDRSCAGGHRVSPPDTLHQQRFAQTSRLRECN